MPNLPQCEPALRGGNTTLLNLNQRMFENQWTATISTETDRDEEADSNMLWNRVTPEINAHNCVYTLAHEHKHTECSIKEEEKKRGEEKPDGSWGERIKN